VEKFPCAAATVYNETGEPAARQPKNARIFGMHAKPHDLIDRRQAQRSQPLGSQCCSATFGIRRALEAAEEPPAELLAS